MLVATFAADTQFAGRVITFFEPHGQFTLEGFGAVSAQAVLDFDARGVLVWARAELRPWVRDWAEWERRLATAAPAASPLPTRGSAVAGARPPRRWFAERLGLLSGIGLIAACLCLAAVLHWDGSGGADSSQVPARMRAITDPGPPLSVPVRKQANAVYRAHLHVLKACLAVHDGDNAAYARQHQAAHADLQVSRSLRPANDGTRQWVLAGRYDRRVARLLTLVEHTTERLHGSVPRWRAVPGFNTCLRRTSAAMNDYYRYVQQTRWAGCVVHGRRFTSVTATWIQPAAYAAGGQERSVVVWVGLDGSGGGSETVEQIGTEVAQSATDPRAWHDAWYEMYPASPVHIPPPGSPGSTGGLVVAPGDTLTATVTSLGSQRFRLELVNRTRGQSFSIVQRDAHATCTSAEIIVESPPLSSGVGFSDFAPVRFTDCAVDGRPLSAYDVKRANTRAYGGRFMTRTSRLSSDGTGFTVTRH